jgi:hypothetical protein
MRRIVRWSLTLRFLRPAILGVSLAFGVIACSGAGVSGTARALSFNGSATLNWTPVTKNTNGTLLHNLAGYRLYYGTSMSSLSTVVELANPNLTTYLVSNLASGTWYFGVTAYTSNGTESAMSNIAQKTIP